MIVCIGSAWDYDPTSKHHIMTVLSAKNEILWIEYRGTRRPVLSAADLRAGWSAVRRMALGAQEAAPHIVRLTPWVIPGGHGWLSQFHRSLLVHQIRRALRTRRQCEGRPVQVWSFAPDVPFLVGKFAEECFVYYCTDEYREFEDMDRNRIAAEETLLLHRADVVITTSQPLYQAKRAFRPDAHLVRHGVEFDHFAQAWRGPLPCPSDLRPLPRPIFGFFGLIHHWMDLPLLSAIARLRPNYTFVLIGERKIDATVLRDCGNVHMLGRRPYAELPAYCAAFDAGLLLFKRSAMTRNINPIKMYEYLAAGLPIISTPLPEAERFHGAIRFADTPEGFAAACDAALSGDGPTRRADISSAVSGESWTSKVEHLSDLIARRPDHSQAMRSGRGESVHNSGFQEVRDPRTRGTLRGVQCVESA